MWWTDIGLYAGDYDGPNFTGASDGAHWNGPEDNSTSTIVMPVTGEGGSGDWYTGEGHSGCSFVGSPIVYNNTGVGGGQVSLSCELRETGAWR